jgi:hypothetical protein
MLNSPFVFCGFVYDIIKKINCSQNQPAHSFLALLKSLPAAIFPE